MGRAAVLPARPRREIAQHTLASTLAPRGLDRRHLAPGPGFAQLELLDLARSGQREGVDHEPVLWRLVRGERGAHVGNQFVLVDGFAGCGADEGRDLFAPALM